MKVYPTALSEVLILEPALFADARGFFFESFNQKTFSKATGLDVRFVQDNHSRSSKGVLRGLHYQSPQTQGKLIRVGQGAVYSVAVDLRRSSSTFGRWVGVELSDLNRLQLWIPPGFAHGFLTVSEWADFLYKTTDFYEPQFEHCLAWDDRAIGINWPLNGALPILSDKDRAGGSLKRLWALESDAANPYT